MQRRSPELPKLDQVATSAILKKKVLKNLDFDHIKKNETIYMKVVILNPALAS